MKCKVMIALVVSLGVLLSRPSFAAPTVYVPLGSANKVIAVDSESNKIVATYSGVENPHGLVATPDGEYLVAGSLKETPLKPDQDVDTLNSQLYLIHLAHGHVMLTIPVAGWTHHQAITSNGRFVISTHATRGYISVVDLESNQVLKTIKTGNGPNSTLITKNGQFAYVSNSASSSISEIGIKNWRVLRTLEAGASPEHMVFSKDESVIYVANPRAGKVSAVSVKKGKINEQYVIGKSVHGLDISDDGDALFVSSKKEDKLVAINLENGTKREIKLSPEPYHLKTIHGTGKVYVSSRKQPIIWVIDQKDFKLLGKIDLPAGEAHQMVVVD